MTQIIAFAGEKQSGKNSACNYITLLKLCENGVSKSGFIDDDGNIQVTDVFGDRPEGLTTRTFSLNSSYVNSELLFNDTVKFCKTYALADELKSFLINTVGLEYSQVYGTDKQKNSKTSLRWQNMPGTITDDQISKIESLKTLRVKMTLSEFKDYIYTEFGLTLVSPGFMTAREVMQYFGTEVCRAMYDDIWVDALIRKIKKEKPEIALVCDARFDNEIKILKQNGAKVLGLTRSIDQKSKKHKSEQINFDLCTNIIKNKNKDIPETCKLIYKAIKDLDCIPNFVED